MSMIERQTELGKSLFQINVQTLTDLAELQRKNIEQFFTANRDFGERVPEVRELGSLMNLQREYGGTLWNNAREAMASQNAILQNAFTETRDALKTAFIPASAESKPEASAPAAQEAPRPKAEARPGAGQVQTG